MREEELEISLKVVIVGNGAVGKSSMIQRFCKGTYTRDYKKTIGVDFLERQIESLRNAHVIRLDTSYRGILPDAHLLRDNRGRLFKKTLNYFLHLLSSSAMHKEKKQPEKIDKSVDGEDVRLMLWDTAGQEEFDAITAAYYRGAHACVLAYSATDRDSFDAIPSWKQKVKNECGEIPTVLVQNKMDLVDQCVIDLDEAEKLGHILGCKLLRTSVKEDVGVMSVFRHLASRCLHEMRRCDDDYQDDLRLYSAGPRSPSVISAFSPNGSTCARSMGNGTIVLRSGAKTKNHKKRNFVKNACRLL
ncbi:LOW QUALITY PROTEIN: ras-related protein Rab-23 [Apis cerana]|uniref:LOW QUALITY PROTEIN: ras-related protein Rab-23 n=1 Tax=Apis cerana TaxID=7461 RepID=UPI002B230AD9|nr:LOW QUALITY PROTEIN: ras-related protein Rab-23 [Apis cerana]